MRQLLLRLIPTAPPLVLGTVVAGLTATETLVAHSARPVAPETWLVLVYLPEVLAISTIWGLALGAASAVLMRKWGAGSVDVLAPAARDREGVGSAVGE
jgi:hypothetical protein